MIGTSLKQKVLINTAEKLSRADSSLIQPTRACLEIMAMGKKLMDLKWVCKQERKTKWRWEIPEIITFHWALDNGSRELCPRNVSVSCVSPHLLCHPPPCKLFNWLLWIYQTVPFRDEVTILFCSRVTKYRDVPGTDAWGHVGTWEWNLSCRSEGTAQDTGGWKRTRENNRMLNYRFPWLHFERSSRAPCSGSVNLG